MALPIAAIVAVSVLAWLGCWALTYAICFAHCQQGAASSRDAEAHYVGDWQWSVFIGLSGPIGLLAALFATAGARHGLKWR